MKLWLTLCLLVASGLPAAAAVVRQPYLQLVTPASITIVWQTDLNSADNSRVQYGTVAGNLTQTAFGAAVIPPSNAAVKNHVVTITGTRRRALPKEFIHILEAYDSSSLYDYIRCCYPQLLRCKKANDLHTLASTGLVK